MPLRTGLQRLRAGRERLLAPVEIRWTVGRDRGPIAFGLENKSFWLIADSFCLFF
jgi:hypothetical protein